MEFFGCSKEQLDSVAFWLGKEKFRNLENFQKIPLKREGWRDAKDS
jgi:hypothetical protein